VGVIPARYPLPASSFRIRPFRCRFAETAHSERRGVVSFAGPNEGGGGGVGPFTVGGIRLNPGGSGWMVDLHELEPLDLPQRAAHPR
jgi:hypothetical protein